MEWISEKMWSVIAAVITACGGYIVYEKKKVDKRLTKLEEERAILNLEIAVMKSQHKDLKEDIGYIRMGLDKIIEKL